MDKQKVTVKVAGREYTLVSADTSEYMSRVADYVNRQLDELSLATRLPSNQVAVLAALNMADELMKSRGEVSRLRRELEAARAEKAE